TLQDDGWVYRRNGDDRYRLSCHLHHIGDNLMAVDALIEAAGPVLDALQGDLLWPSDVAVRKGLNMEVVETTRKKQDLLVNRPILGDTLDILRSAPGQAYFAFCTDTERAEILERLALQESEVACLARNENWVVSMLETVRQQGYGRREAREGADVVGDLAGIAVPVLVDGRVKACINVVWPEGALAQERVEALVLPRLQQAATELSDGVRQAFFADE
ncbi:MAG TPA: IclR family transcriptional regulator C-terminal domain-containing protein, partial [Motiliproteus sp.]